MKGEEENPTKMEEDDDEDDPVVKEIPVFASQRLHKQLYVLKYPLRPKATKTPLNVKECFVKPENQCVKLETQLDTTSPAFDIDRAEDIAFKIDGPPEFGKKNKDRVFERNILDRLSYVSSKAVEDSSNYGIGVFNGREVHITELKGILRMDPYYPHLDLPQKKKQESKHNGIIDDDDNDEPGTSKAQPVTVKFSRAAPNEKVKQIQSNSYKAMLQKRDEEPWTRCEWHPEESELAKMEKNKLYSENTKSTSDPKDSEEYSAAAYLRKLVPEDVEHSVIQPSLPSNIVSYSALRSLPLAEQCKRVLKDAKIVSFYQLRLLLTGSEGLTAENLLKILPQVAVLVRGNWIVKSEILYPPETFSAISGVPAEFMCRARDYILILFTKGQYVERRKVSSVIRVPAEEIKEIFTSISKLRHSKGWELNIPSDVEFVNKYPEIVQRQNAQWEQREQQLHDLFAQTHANKETKRRKSKSFSDDTGAKTNK